MFKILVGNTKIFECFLVFTHSIDKKKQDTHAKEISSTQTKRQTNPVTSCQAACTLHEGLSNIKSQH